MILVFDTETTGKWHFDLPSNAVDQPHLVGPGEGLQEPVQRQGPHPFVVRLEIDDPGIDQKDPHRPPVSFDIPIAISSPCEVDSYALLVYMVYLSRIFQICHERRTGKSRRPEISGLHKKHWADAFAGVTAFYGFAVLGLTGSGIFNI